MKMAHDAAEISYAKRKQVGAILVVPDGCRFEGVNGMPSGFDNCCETEENKTKQECLHAESNAIAKVARSTASSVGGTLYCTLSPCLECAKLVVQAGIIRVVYGEQYPYLGHTGEVRALGLDLLREAGIQVDNLDLCSHNVGNEEPNCQDEGRYYDPYESWRDYRP